MKITRHAKQSTWGASLTGVIYETEDGRNFMTDPTRNGALSLITEDCDDVVYVPCNDELTKEFNDALAVYVA